MGNFLVQIVGQTGVRHGVRSLGTLLIHIFVAVVLSDAAVAQEIPPLLRFPHCSRDRIVFVAEGDLWIVPRSGGTAKRLTHDVGQVFMPHFSPDGAEIAFTVRRGGLNDVWSIPAFGGDARRLTHGPSSGAYDNMVTGWTPDGSAVLFLSSRYSAFPKRDVAAFAVPAMGGLARKLPMETSGLLSEAQDGQAFAFDRTFRTFGGDRWKRYVGGQAPQIFVYDTRSGRQRQVTHWIGTNTAPMWWRDRLYFLSDRGRSRRLDLWVTDAEGQNARQVTHTRALDIDVPALGADAITFGLGGRIWQLDLPAEQLHEVPVAVAPSGRLQERSVAAAPSVRVSDIAGAPDQSLSPDGATATFAARGHLFIRKGDGTTRDLHAGSATDDDHPSISPDGRTVAFISDGDGDERQVAAMPLAGGPVRWLTRVAGSVFGTPVWSPDGSMLAVPDEEHGLWLVASDGSSARRVAMDPIAAIRDGTFSRDGRRLAYSTTRPSGASMLHLLDLGTARDTVLTPPLESDHAPAFSADGRTLFFLSARHDRPVLADRDQGPDIVTAESDGLYRVAIPLAPAMPAPALTRGASPVPSAPGVLSKPEVRGDVLFYRTNEAALVNGTLPGPPPSIHALELGSGRDRVVADGDGSVVSGDGKTVLLRRAGAWHTVDTAIGRDTRLDLSALRVTIDPKLEWQKGIDEAWHLDRDLFWDRTMGGLDWSAAGARYEALGRLAGSQEDEVYILGEMQGELSSSHMFVAGSDDGDGATPTALLGVDFIIDSLWDRYRFGHVYRGDPSRPRFRAPLGAADLDVHDGDVLLAIDGQELRVPDDPYRLLAAHSGPLRLTLSRAPDGPRRDITVDPVPSEIPIRQLDWIEKNRARVDTLSHGQVGYVYLGDFSEAGAEDFDRQYYAQTEKRGLVIDERWNTGGFTSQWVISVLRRLQLGTFRNREGGVTALPGSPRPPSIAVVTNIFAASDGDQFPYFMQRLHLATIVGERTWGGVAGIAGPWPLMDGVTVTVPKDRLFAQGGRSILENRGAEPDVSVSNSPSELAAGVDAQLDRAVLLVLGRSIGHGAGLSAPE